MGNDRAARRVCGCTLVLHGGTAIGILSDLGICPARPSSVVSVLVNVPTCGTLAFVGKCVVLLDVRKEG